MHDYEDSSDYQDESEPIVATGGPWKPYAPVMGLALVLFMAPLFYGAIYSSLNPHTSLEQDTIVSPAQLGPGCDCCGSKIKKDIGGK